MSHNKRRNVLSSENRTSKELALEMERKILYQRELANQVAERKAQDLAKKEEEERLHRQFEEMQITMANHIKMQEDKKKAKMNQNKKDKLAEVLNSNANCINTALSKNYVLKHRETTDYNTLTDTSDLKPDLIRNDSGKQVRLRQMRTKLEEAKKKAMEALEEKEKRETKLFELKSQLKRMQQEKEGYMIKLKEALVRNNVPETSNVFLCETDFIPVSAQDLTNHKLEQRQPRYSVGDKTAYKIHSGGRKWSTRGASSKCEKEIKDLQGLIDNYYRR